MVGDLVDPENYYQESPYIADSLTWPKVVPTRLSILKKATKAIEHLASAQKDHAEQKVVFNTNEDRR